MGILIQHVDLTRHSRSATDLFVRATESPSSDRPRPTSNRRAPLPKSYTPRLIGLRAKVKHLSNLDRMLQPSKNGRTTKRFNDISEAIVLSARLMKTRDTCTRVRLLYYGLVSQVNVATTTTCQSSLGEDCSQST